MRYRVLFFWQNDRQAKNAVEFSSADDEQAINLILGLDDRANKELWSGRRRVATIRAASVLRPQMTAPRHGSPGPSL